MKRTTTKISEELAGLNPANPNYRQRRMKLMVEYLNRYMETYDQQAGYENYNDNVLVNDILYGLGVALDPKRNRFANGFDNFKGYLQEFLNGDKEIFDK